jgi:hypothetical protein
VQNPQYTGAEVAAALGGPVMRLGSGAFGETWRREDTTVKIIWDGTGSEGRHDLDHSLSQRYHRQRHHQPPVEFSPRAGQLLRYLDRAPVTIHRTAEHDRHRLFRAALPARAPAELQLHNRDLKPALPSTDLVAETVSTTVIDFDRQLDLRARAFSSSSRNNPDRAPF